MDTTRKILIAAGALLLVSYLAFSGILFFREDSGTSNERHLPSSQPAGLETAGSREGDGAATGATAQVPDDGAIPAEALPVVPFAEAEELLPRYGKALEVIESSPGRVFDVSRLPATKVRLKSAILTYLKEANDPGAEEALKGPYLLLAYFQVGVGDSPIPVDQRASDGRPWSEAIAAEMKVLQAELANARR